AAPRSGSTARREAGGPWSGHRGGGWKADRSYSCRLAPAILLRMKTASLAAAAALLFMASPAFATSTILCRSTISPTDGPQLWLTVGGGPGSGIVQARLEQGNGGFTTGEGQGAPVVGQSWL